MLVAHFYTSRSLKIRHEQSWRGLSSTLNRQYTGLPEDVVAGKGLVERTAIDSIIHADRSRFLNPCTGLLLGTLC
jgi:hypothetical protein